MYAERAQAMSDALRAELARPWTLFSPGGLFVWARLTGAGGAVQDGNLLAQRAIAKGVAFVPGAPFFAPTRPGHVVPVLRHGRRGEDPRGRGAPGQALAQP